MFHKFVFILFHSTFSTGMCRSEELSLGTNLRNNVFSRICIWRLPRICSLADGKMKTNLALSSQQSSDNGLNSFSSTFIPPDRFLDGSSSNTTDFLFMSEIIQKEQYVFCHVVCKGRGGFRGGRQDLRPPPLRFRGKKCSQFDKSYVFFNLSKLSLI